MVDRLAPEHPWPGPHEDMYDAVKWVISTLGFQD
jgi:acetyl esterase/lipase